MPRPPQLAAESALLSSMLGALLRLGHGACAADALPDMAHAAGMATAHARDHGAPSAALRAVLPALLYAAFLLCPPRAGELHCAAGAALAPLATPDPELRQQLCTLWGVEPPPDAPHREELLHGLLLPLAGATSRVAAAVCTANERGGSAAMRPSAPGLLAPPFRRDAAAFLSDAAPCMETTWESHEEGEEADRGGVHGGGGGPHSLGALFVGGGDCGAARGLSCALSAGARGGGGGSPPASVPAPRGHTCADAHVPLQSAASLPACLGDVQFPAESHARAWNVQPPQQPYGGDLHPQQQQQQQGIVHDSTPSYSLLSSRSDGAYSVSASPFACGVAPPGALSASSGSPVWGTPQGSSAPSCALALAGGAASMGATHAQTCAPHSFVGGLTTHAQSCAPHSFDGRMTQACAPTSLDSPQALFPHAGGERLGATAALGGGARGSSVGGGSRELPPSLHFGALW